MDYLHRYASPLGPMLLGSDGNALVGLWFEGQKNYAAGLNPERKEAPLPVFDLADRWLDEYFSGRMPECTPPLRPRGTLFCQGVWRALLRIPWGQTVSYGILAAQLRTSPRAVGAAVGRNPISVIIPCHRVIGADGSLTGYAGGIDRKAALLALEQRGDVCVMKGPPNGRSITVR